MNKKNVNFIAEAIHSLTEGMKELTEDSDRAFHNLTEGMKELTEKVEELKNSIDDGGVFKPQDGEEYWFISAGTAWMDNRGGNSLECDQYAIGNCFPTQQAAEDVVRVLKLIKKARESQDGFVPDWEDWEQNKNTLCFDMVEIWVTSHLSLNIAPVFGFWGDESECKQFIEDNHDELLWFFTEYER